MRGYGPKRRTKQDVAAAAVMLVVLSDRSREDKIEALVKSYGKPREQAERLVDQ
jgi:hypothetical protein